MPRSSKSRFNSAFSRALPIFLHVYAQNAHVLNSPTAIPSNACAGKKGKGFANRPSPHLPHIAAVKGPKDRKRRRFLLQKPTNQRLILHQQAGIHARRRTHQEAPPLSLSYPCRAPLTFRHAPFCASSQHASQKSPQKAPQKAPPSQRLSPHRTRCVPPPHKKPTCAPSDQSLTLPFAFLRRGTFFVPPLFCPTFLLFTQYLSLAQRPRAHNT